MKKNINIKKEADRIVLNYERKKGRMAKLVEKGGYDILSKSKKEIRHIEVKGTSKIEPSFRQLTAKEFKTLSKDPDSYLYLVCGVGKKPKLFVFDREKILSRFQRVELNFIVGFKRSDFRKEKSKGFRQMTLLEVTP
jgi:hypothetical protein